LGRKKDKEKEKWLKRVAILFLVTRIGFIGSSIGMMCAILFRSLIGAMLFFAFVPLIIVPAIIIYLSRNKWKEKENK